MSDGVMHLLDAVRRGRSHEHGRQVQEQGRRKLRGKAKEKVGEATGDDSWRPRAKRDQSKADLKQAGEKVKDAFKK